MSGDAVERLDLFVEQEGAELGLRFEGWRDLSASLTYFWLESDSELLFVGDSGSTEASDASERTGVELSMFWNVNPLWTVDVNASLVDSKFVDVPSNVDHIPNAHGQVIGAGLTYAEAQGWLATLRMRHFSDASLDEGDTVQHGDTTLFNAALSYDFGAWQAGIELINLFDAKDDDIAYFYESRLSGELNGVEDVHFHPVVPFSVRLNVRYKFGG